MTPCWNFCFNQLPIRDTENKTTVARFPSLSSISSCSVCRLKFLSSIFLEPQRKSAASFCLSQKMFFIFSKMFSLH